MDFNESLANELIKKNRFQPSTLERWKRNGGIPARILNKHTGGDLVFGYTLIEARQLLNYSQRELADKIRPYLNKHLGGELKLSHQMVSGWENGSKPISRVYYNRVIEFYEGQLRKAKVAPKQGWE